MPWLTQRFRLPRTIWVGVGPGLCKEDKGLLFQALLLNQWCRVPWACFLICKTALLFWDVTYRVARSFPADDTWGNAILRKLVFWRPLQTFQHVLWIILNGGKLSSHKDALVWGISWVVCSPAWRTWQLKRVIPSETPEEVGPLLPDPAPLTPGHQPWRATEHLGLAARNWYVLKCQIYTRFGRLKECKTAHSSMIFLSYWLRAEMALFGSKWAK